MTTPANDAVRGDGEPRFTCTFGIYNQVAPWTDIRSLTWVELATLLTTHEVGQKEGTCLVPATFRGSKRTKADAGQIDVVLLDSDAGALLPEISSALTVKGWTGVVSSTNSHLTTTTKVKRGNWDKYRVAQAGEANLPERYLIEVKGYLSRVARSASILCEEGEFTVFKHQPCPKFRVALPLARPWLAVGYDNQRQANAAWKERIEALAAALSLSHDQACTDTSRLFYLPRRPIDGPAGRDRDPRRQPLRHLRFTASCIEATPQEANDRQEQERDLDVSI